MSDVNYWEECIANAAEEVSLGLTDEQLKYLAESVNVSHENYGMAFYSPPQSDRMSAVEHEYKEKYKRLEIQFTKYRDNAETAIKRALNQHSGANVSIGEHGEVTRYGGRTERIL